MILVGSADFVNIYIPLIADRAGCVSHVEDMQAMALDGERQSVVSTLLTIVAPPNLGTYIDHTTLYQPTLVSMSTLCVSMALSRHDI